ncbi:Hypothetical predicted protein [Cloeon dipterum]|uniref:VWFC domain-containing protein n=1 Tax=Cloeon dipterum TaxID=197152 RepID=A0A8S1CU26_9INSE|nr:Hypothetical predicted protein [Cloeon dipterum]
MAVSRTARSPSWLLIAAALPFLFMFVLKPVRSAPTETEDATALETYDGSGCYYNYQHYGEGDRIITNEPCLNCTCHNRMLMCYLKVCPFTKAIGSDCTVEKRPDQCCPVITCPEVPVQLVDNSLSPSTTLRPVSQQSTAVGHPDSFGCSIDSEFYADGAQVPSDKNKPCELCYCIRNHTACVMQECTLNVEGCKPVFQDGICCPVRYECEYPDETTTLGSIAGFFFTTTTTISPSTMCKHNGEEYADGALIQVDDKPCEHCYCMRGEIVCAVQECGTPLEREGHNCTALPTQPGKCCPEMYQCDGIEYVMDTTNRMNRKQYGLSVDDTTLPSIPEASSKPEDDVPQLPQHDDQASGVALNADEEEKQPGDVHTESPDHVSYTETKPAMESDSLVNDDQEDKQEVTTLSPSYIEEPAEDSVAAQEPVDQHPSEEAQQEHVDQLAHEEPVQDVHLDGEQEHEITHDEITPDHEIHHEEPEVVQPVDPTPEQPAQEEQKESEAEVSAHTDKPVEPESDAVNEEVEEHVAQDQKEPEEQEHSTEASTESSLNAQDDEVAPHHEDHKEHNEIHGEPAEIVQDSVSESSTEVGESQDEVAAVTEPAAEHVNEPAENDASDEEVVTDKVDIVHEPAEKDEEHVPADIHGEPAEHEGIQHEPVDGEVEHDNIPANEIHHEPGHEEPTHSEENIHLEPAHDDTIHTDEGVQHEPVDEEPAHLDESVHHEPAQEVPTHSEEGIQHEPAHHEENVQHEPTDDETVVHEPVEEPVKPAEQEPVKQTQSDNEIPQTTEQPAVDIEVATEQHLADNISNEPAEIESDKAPEHHETVEQPAELGDQKETVPAEVVSVTDEPEKEVNTETPVQEPEVHNDDHKEHEPVHSVSQDEPENPHDDQQSEVVQDPVQHEPENIEVHQDEVEQVVPTTSASFVADEVGSEKENDENAVQMDNLPVEGADEIHPEPAHDGVEANEPAVPATEQPSFDHQDDNVNEPQEISTESSEQQKPVQDNVETVHQDEQEVPSHDQHENVETEKQPGFEVENDAAEVHTEPQLVGTEKPEQDQPAQEAEQISDKTDAPVHADKVDELVHDHAEEPTPVDIAEKPVQPDDVVAPIHDEEPVHSDGLEEPVDNAEKPVQSDDVVAPILDEEPVHSDGLEEPVDTVDDEKPVHEDVPVQSVPAEQEETNEDHFSVVEVITKPSMESDSMVHEAEEPVKQVEEPVKDEVQPVKEVEEPVKDEVETVEKVTEPVKEEVEPVKQVEEPVKDEVQPVKEVEEPVKDEVETVEEVTEPVKQVGEPVKDEVQPAKEVEEPVKDEVEPVEEVTEPVKEEVEPVKQVEEPVKDEMEPVKEVEEPVKDVEEPVKEVEADKPEEQTTENTFTLGDIIEEVNKLPAIINLTPQHPAMQDMEEAQHHYGDEDDHVESQSDSKEPETEIEDVKESEKPINLDSSVQSSEEVTEASDEISTESNEESKVPVIPGEGDCRIDNDVYKNGENIPVSNNCQKVCECKNSIAQCQLQECPPPPTTNRDCMPVVHEGKCCPTYTCEHEPQYEIVISPSGDSVHDESHDDENNHDEEFTTQAFAHSTEAPATIVESKPADFIQDEISSIPQEVTKPDTFEQDEIPGQSSHPAQVPAFDGVALDVGDDESGKPTIHEDRPAQQPIYDHVDQQNTEEHDIEIITQAAITDAPASAVENQEAQFDGAEETHHQDEKESEPAVNHENDAEEIATSAPVADVADVSQTSEADPSQEIEADVHTDAPQASDEVQTDAPVKDAEHVSEPEHDAVSHSEEPAVQEPQSEISHPAVHDDKPEHDVVSQPEEPAVQEPQSEISHPAVHDDMPADVAVTTEEAEKEAPPATFAPEHVEPAKPESDDVSQTSDAHDTEHEQVTFTPDAIPEVSTAEAEKTPDAPAESDSDAPEWVKPPTPIGTGFNAEEIPEHHDEAETPSEHFIAEPIPDVVSEVKPSRPVEAADQTKPVEAEQPSEVANEPLEHSPEVVHEPIDHNEQPAEEPQEISQEHVESQPEQAAHEPVETHEAESEKQPEQPTEIAHEPVEHKPEQHTDKPVEHAEYPNAPVEIQPEVPVTTEASEIQPEQPAEISHEPVEEHHEVSHEPAEVKPEEPTDAVHETVEVKPEEPTDAVHEPVEVKPEETTDAVHEPAEFKPEEPTDAVHETVEVKPEEPTDAVHEPVEVKPEETTDAVHEAAEFKPEEPTNAVHEPVEVKPEEPTDAVHEPVEITHEPTDVKPEEPVDEPVEVTHAPTEVKPEEPVNEPVESQPVEDKPLEHPTDIEHGGADQHVPEISTETAEVSVAPEVPSDEQVHHESQTEIEQDKGEEPKPQVQVEFEEHHQISPEIIHEEHSVQPAEQHVEEQTSEAHHEEPEHVPEVHHEQPQEHKPEEHEETHEEPAPVAPEDPKPAVHEETKPAEPEEPEQVEEVYKPDQGLSQYPDMTGLPSFEPFDEMGFPDMSSMPGFEEEQGSFGPGTCRYGGKVYLSAQQIPREDPCDFCFCFRSDIICLQQSCPPPIKGCHEEAIDGFCCPRYECPVTMALRNSSSTTTTTTTAAPSVSDFIYSRQANAGCLVQGELYRVGDEITTASGPCLECRCGGDSKMRCEPKECSPQPLIRKMIEAVSLRR